MLAIGLMGFLAGFPGAMPGAGASPRMFHLEAHQEIHIQADEVIADLDSGETRFEGHVKISQGQTTVTTDRMKVYYRKTGGDLKNLDLKASIYKIAASGNVKINYENMVALTDEAVYMADSDSLTLSGTDSKVISGANSITGPKFIMFLESGSLIIEGGGGQRVQALIFPGGAGLF
jgi:lipopolysaccharide export system protein LptA